MKCTKVSPAGKFASRSHLQSRLTKAQSKEKQHHHLQIYQHQQSDHDQASKHFRTNQKEKQQHNRQQSCWVLAACSLHSSCVLAACSLSARCEFNACLLTASLICTSLMCTCLKCTYVCLMHYLNSLENPALPMGHFYIPTGHLPIWLS